MYFVLPAIILLSGVFIGQITGCSGVAQNNASKPHPMLMPAWFWETPAGTTVGYAPRYYALENSYTEAFKDAAERAFTDEGFRITGGRASAWDGSSVMSLGASFEITPLNPIPPDGQYFGVVRLDSFATDDLVIMLVGKGFLSIDNQITGSLSKSRLENGGSLNQITGIGFAPLYHHINSSWIEAENNARLEIALTAVNIRAENAQSGDLLRKTTLLEVDADLRGVASVRRAVDPSTNSVWVKASAGNIARLSP